MDQLLEQGGRIVLAGMDHPVAGLVPAALDPCARSPAENTGMPAGRVADAVAGQRLRAGGGASAPADCSKRNAGLGAPHQVQHRVGAGGARARQIERRVAVRGAGGAWS